MLEGVVFVVVLTLNGCLSAPRFLRRLLVEALPMPAVVLGPVRFKVRLVPPRLEGVFVEERGPIVVCIGTVCPSAFNDKCDVSDVER